MVMVMVMMVMMVMMVVMCDKVPILNTFRQSVIDDGDGDGGGGGGGGDGDSMVVVFSLTNYQH